MYETFYNLKTKPFRLSPDPRFLFNSRSHLRAMAYLRYGLQMGEGFIVVTGDIGAGKTTLVRALMANLAKENMVAAQIVTTQLESDDLLRMVAGAFGLPCQDVSKAAVLRNLESFMLARSREGKRIVLLVDEAQNLPAKSLEELRMLSNFQSGDRALLQSFLLGQEELREIMQSEGMEQFRQRVIAAHHLGPLEAQETRQYVKHRLCMAGWTDDPHFTDDAFELIHDKTGGIPRKINLLCDRVLLYGYLEEVHEVSGETVQLVVDERSREMPAGPDRESTAEVHAAAPRPGQLQLASNAVNDTERRLLALERRLDGIEANARKEQERLHKLLMMTLLSDNGMDLSQAIDRIRKVDKA
ncbi:MAG: XrtA/PEP-CTERM system-associated ATPase [Gammaproteobacteria bacterium]